MVGGGVGASARRFGVGFGPIKDELVDCYLEECRKVGREPGLYWWSRSTGSSRR
jgi:hypothetical protein